MRCCLPRDRAQREAQARRPPHKSPRCRSRSAILPPTERSNTTKETNQECRGLREPGLGGLYSSSQHAQAMIPEPVVTAGPLGRVAAPREVPPRGALAEEQVAA